MSTKICVWIIKPLDWFNKKQQNNTFSRIKIQNWGIQAVKRPKGEIAATSLMKPPTALVMKEIINPHVWPITPIWSNRVVTNLENHESWWSFTQISMWVSDVASHVMPSIWSNSIRSPSRHPAISPTSRGGGFVLSLHISKIPRFPRRDIYESVDLTFNFSDSSASVGPVWDSKSYELTLWVFWAFYLPGSPFESSQQRTTPSCQDLRHTDAKFAKKLGQFISYSSQLRREPWTE